MTALRKRLWRRDRRKPIVMATKPLHGRSRPPRVPEGDTLTRTNATSAARMLEEILKWKIHLTPTYRSVQAIRYDNDASPATGDTGLPFGLNQVIDSGNSPNHDHPDELNTTAAVDKWLRFWNPWISYWTNSPSVYRETPGPWYLKQLQEHEVFQTIDAWDEEDADTWDEFTSELRTVWTRLRTATGNAPRRTAPCPSCWTSGDPERRHAHLQAAPTTQHGYSTTWTCPTCHAIIPEDAYQETLIRALQDTQDKNAWVTAAQIKQVLPFLDQRKLRVWKNRGHIDYQSHNRTYRLTDITARIWP